MKCDSAEPLRFQSSYVSGAYVPPRGAVGGTPATYGNVRPALFSAGLVDIPRTAPVPALLDDHDPVGVPAAHGQRSVLDVVVERLAGQGSPAHEVWLPPLDESPAVGDLATAIALGELRIPLGIVDRPYDQRRDVLTLDLAGAQGNIAIVGGPQSGKSTAVRTLVVGTALTHTPRQAQFYCLDFGGGSLAALATMPHVGSVASRLDPDRVRRTVAEVTALMRRREALFRDRGIESIREYRSSFAPNARVTYDDPFGDVFLVIDGWAVLRAEFEQIEPAVTAIVTQGLSYGVHVVATASRWGEIRPAVKDQLGTRIELKLGDALDSEMGRAVAAAVPVNRPGRGVTAEQLHMLVALPRTDGGSSADDIAEGLMTAITAVQRQYPGQVAPTVRMLPGSFDIGTLAPPPGGLAPGSVVFGLGENELSPTIADFEVQPFVVITGESGCGKTELLHTVASSLAAHGGPTRCKLVVVDYRRSLLGAFPAESMAGYATSSQALTPMMAQLAALLAERCPPEGITPQQLRDRDWWTGPEVYVIVDDYDLVASGSAGNPMLPLVPYLPQARDVGLRVVVGRRSGGIGRALFDPFLGGLKDLSADALVMSGSRDEGTVFGVRMSALPAGRGTWVSRSRGTELVQVGLVPRSDG